MQFSWDPEKSEENYRLRSFDFAFASAIFDGPTLERQDNRLDYGEVRVAAIGLADGLELTVIYTDRLGPGQALARRIISARRSNRCERSAYQASLKAK